MSKLESGQSWTKLEKIVHITAPLVLLIANIFVQVIIEIDLRDNPENREILFYQSIASILPWFIAIISVVMWGRILITKPVDKSKK